MALPADFIERLKAANPIADVMGTYVTLKRTGRDYVCLCPFHNEKTPSCHVHPEREYFHCFGCGAGGDVITFTMRYNSLDYMDAVRFLADRSGMTVPENPGYNNASVDKRKRIYEMNKKAARFFYDCLRSPDGKACREYLAKRGLTAQTIMKYGMGFAPNSWSRLKDHMLAEGFTEKELEEASLISRSQKNTRNTFDFFVNRAMFPFFDLRGNIVGFGGRALSNDDKRKYLNSKATPAYTKERYLFSMNFAKNVSVKTGRLLLCEGNLDVISLNQAGFENAVASCGTSLTPEQVKLMSGYAKEVTICYDSDEAGQKAAKKAIDLLREADLKAYVAIMEGAKDPDEYINKFGKAKFEHVLDKAVDSVAFELSNARGGSNTSTDTGKADYIRKACEIIIKLHSPVERDIYITRLANEQGISKSAIEQQVREMIHKKTNDLKRKREQDVLNFANRRDPLNPEAVIFPRENIAEKQLIYYLYMNPDQCADISDRLPAEKFVTSLNKRIYTSLVRKIKAGEDISFSSFYDEFSADEVGRITSIINECSQLDVDRNVAEECIKLLLDAGNKKADESKELSDEEMLNIAAQLRKKKNG